MTQARLAELVGKSASAVRSWERGRAAPKGEATRAALAAVLGVTDQELQAAIDGVDISFFSDPGRPIAADPSPTIVQPISEPMDDSPMTEEPAAEPPASEVAAFVDAEQEPEEPMAEEVEDSEPGEEPSDESQELPASDGDDEGIEVVEDETGEIAADDQSDGDEASPAEQSREATQPPEARDEQPDSADVEGERPDEPTLDREPIAVPAAMVESVPVVVAEPATATRPAARRQSTGPAAILTHEPVVELDPVARDAWLYRRRLLLFGVGIVVLVVVLRWALGGVSEALSEIFDNLRSGL